MNNLREKSLEWFFTKDENDKINLKEKYFSDVYIEKSSQWGFHFTFEQIEKMYLEEVKN